MGKPEDDFFRGSELPRLLILAGIMVAGWVAVLAWRGQPVPARREATPVAALRPLPPPRSGEEFEGIQDRTPMTVRDNAAYAELVRLACETPYEQLAAESRRDVLFAQLLEDPARYRGLPIHIEGTALRVLRQDATGSKVYPGGVSYEAYVITQDSLNNPWVISFEKAPAALEAGDNLRQQIAFDGYFLKLVAYQAGDGRFRVAPLLVGRFPPASGPSAGAPAPARPWSTREWSIVALGTLSVYLALRLAWQLRKTLARPAPRRYFDTEATPVRDSIAPEELSAWLERVGRPEGAPEAPSEGNGQAPARPA